MGIKVGVRKVVETVAKSVTVFAKVSDRGNYALKDQYGEEFHNDDDGYVPEFLSGGHGSDYLSLEIDLETGHIMNWKAPTRGNLEEFMQRGEE